MLSHTAAYGLVLRAYPSKFRQAYGPEMTRLFSELLADRRRTGQTLGVLRLWAHTVADTFSSAARERSEETKMNATALTRSLLIVFPVAAYAAFAGFGLYAGLAALVAGIIVLTVRRRSLPAAITGSWRSRWWVWTLAGIALVGGSFGTAAFIDFFGDDSSETTGELSWIIWSLLFFSGASIIAASVVRALVLLLRKPATPTG